MPQPSSRPYTLVACTLLLFLSGACRSSPSSAGAPEIGAAAPEFTVRPVTRDGVAADSVSLASLRGKTVVLAFFPKARTPGCTTQMKAYRDRYATLFHGGRDVVLLAASTDDPTDLEAWARDEQFPFAFVSDPDGTLGAQFGAMEEGDWIADRVLYVIAPDGTVAYKAVPFRQSSEDAYTELGAAIDRVATP